MIKSARFPGSRVPIKSSMYIALAPKRVAIDRAVAAGTVVGSPVIPFASNAAKRISSNISRSLLDAGPSVPIPTFKPNSSILLTGAAPEASLRLDEGQWTTPALWWCKVCISPSSMCTQWAAKTLASKRLFFFTYGITGIPFSAREFSTSDSVSARWV